MSFNRLSLGDTTVTCKPLHLDNGQIADILNIRDIIVGVSKSWHMTTRYLNRIQVGRTVSIVAPYQHRCDLRRSLGRGPPGQYVRKHYIDFC